MVHSIVVLLTVSSLRKGYHKTKSGKMAKKGLWYNIAQKKKKGKKIGGSKGKKSKKGFFSKIFGKGKK